MPIAIVGRACVLPGALGPTALWQAVVEGRDLLGSAPAGRWRLAPEGALCSADDPHPDRAWNDRGGYVEGFEAIWNPQGFAIEADELAAFDPLLHWLLHCSREALAESLRGAGHRVGAIFGNLGFPSESMAAYADDIWRNGRSTIDPRNRFMGGATAQLLQRALQLDGGCFSLDAACASSLYAIKLACDRLRDGTADLMLAGAVQRADDLFLHVGFSALNALSRSGQSRPFHRDADGLLPAEGCAMLALKRLADARRDGDTVHAVIRGIGLSNDGRGKGLLVPDEAGQQRAMLAAYAAAGLAPAAVSLLECHATGTPVGDATELRSSGKVFAAADALPIGSLKSNLGHLITVAGAAGLIKLIEAMRAGIRPPSLHAGPVTEALAGTPFRLLQEAEEWPAQQPRIAALSAFGFGGNNAHLVLSEDHPSLPLDAPAAPPSVAVAVVGIGCTVGPASDRAGFSTALFDGRDLRDQHGESPLGPITLDLDGLRIPPRDLQQCLPQQLAMLQATREALSETAPLPRDRTAVLVGMEPDAEVARYGTRWRLAETTSGAQLDALQDAVIAPLEAAGVLGCMPNIPANRLSSQFDLAGPAFTLQCGDASGLQALQVGCRALAAGEVDAAVIGAVDIGCETVNRAASPAAPGDAAVVLLLKRLDDAERDGDRIYAVVQDDGESGGLPLPALPQFGHAGAADGLLRVAAAALALHHRRHPGGRPWLSVQPRQFELPLSGQPSLHLRGRVDQPLRNESALPRLHLFSGADRQAVIAALQQGRSDSAGEARLVLVATDAELDQVRSRALAHLLHGAPAGNAIHFRERPIGGALAFVFAGAGASYPGMGRELLQYLPQLGDAVAQRSERLATALDWAFEADPQSPGVLQQLWGASALSQLHVEFTQGVLGLRPDAWMGYSSGETNALVAARVWNDPDALIADILASGLTTDLLGGEFSTLRQQWGRPVQWASWTVLATPEEVRAASDGVEHVHLAIINGAADCLIAGDAEGCRTVVERLGRARCLPLDYPLAVHVPEVAAVADQWLQVHRRDTAQPRCGRIYSSAWGRAYAVDRERCAQAILAQADRMLDIRPLVLQAWDDGIRVFVEHGPRGSFGRAIRGILGARDALVVSLDRKGQGIEALLGAVAALLAAGVPLQHERLQALLEPARQLPKSRRPMQFAAHWPAVGQLPRRGDASALRPIAAPLASQVEAVHRRQPRNAMLMVPAPRLPPVLGVMNRTADHQRAVHAVDLPPAAVQLPLQAAIATPAAAATDGLLAAYREQLGRIAGQHAAWLELERSSHAQFLQQRGLAQALLLQAAGPGGPPLAIAAQTIEPSPATPHGASNDSTPAPAIDVAPSQSAAAATAPAASQPATAAQPVATRPRTPPIGPAFTHEQLLIHADGRVSDLFGPQFAAQDGHARQVRMPKPPLLLADRVLGIDGIPGSMGQGTIWTETDVGATDWYLHHGRMPAGVMIEAGQADLMLISWLGVDALNRGERVYRLLGCELTYHGDLPRDGDTLRFDIHIDGHAAQDDVRLMFFHYDCDNGGRRQLSVRKGQAGFFSDAELAASAGCLWTPQGQAIVDNPRFDPPEVECTRRAFDRPQLEAFAAGDPLRCFGPGFELAQTHTRSPSIHGGRMLLLDRVGELDPAGGPWQRGYLRAELDIEPAQWFFDGHFKNDPCMPGTLMFEGCLQAMALYLAACGFTLRRDGWRFQPVPEMPYQLQCRGQVTPRSRLLTTELFVEELISGPQPTLIADLLCTVDGLKAFHARRVALQLVPDWPLDDAAGRDRDPRPVAVVDGFRFDQRSLLACATGRPSLAFGPVYRRFDGPMRVARLPGPPYLFISRIAEVHGPIGVMRAGARVVAEYDLPDEVWYLQQNGTRQMPFAVLLEAALQPCGWLSSYVGSALTVDAELGFRNLDGEGTVLAEPGPGDGVLRTEVELLDVSASAGMIIETFAVSCRIGEREVYRLRTVFGFFPPEALAAQAGLATSAEQRELLQRPANCVLDLSQQPIILFDDSRPRLPGPMLRMIERIEGWWPQGGAAGLGQLRAVKDIDPAEWFFKAHFFQDPVQPGSLGLEAMLQCLQACMLLHGHDQGLEDARFECIALDQPHQWKYRGQVLPQHRQVHTTLELTAVGSDDRGRWATADAHLWVDGQRIYEARGLGVRLVSGQSR